MLLGQLHLKFQLHMKTLLISMKGDIAKEEDVASQNKASSGPEEGGTSLPPQFVVGAGASFKKARRVRTFNPFLTVGVSRKEMEGKKSGMPSKRLPLIGGTVRLCADTVMGTGADPPHLYSAANVWGEGGQRVDESTLVVGAEQMAVIEELVERGTRLRDRMVRSMMGEDQLEQHPGRYITSVPCMHMGPVYISVLNISVSYTYQCLYISVSCIYLCPVYISALFIPVSCIY